MASKSGRTPNFSEEEELLMAELGREFPKVERKQILGKKCCKNSTPEIQMESSGT